MIFFFAISVIVEQRPWVRCRPMGFILLVDVISLLMLIGIYMKFFGLFQLQVGCVCVRACVCMINEKLSFGL